MKKDISMFMAVAQSSRAQVALTCAQYAYVKKIAAIKQKLTLSSQLPWPEHLKWIPTDDLVDAKGAADALGAALSYPRSEDVAFLQYTSGSTSAPKGVVLTHGNLTHNLRTISSALHAGRDTVVVSWLPQYHDMGLIGAYLGTIFNGGTGVYLSPFSFIKNPCLWIQLISKHRATHLQAPNFAYALLARKADQLHADSSIDLSSVRHMINGAEPIQGDAMDSFYRAFSPFGLPAGVVKPTYGLAEHTVYVCGSGSQRVWVDKPRLERDGVFQVVPAEKQSTSGELKEMIGCGVPSKKDHGIDLRIVDPETGAEKKDGEAGEIWISSASKARGYFGDDMKALSDEAFQAKLTYSNDGEYPSTTFMRTGDLGVLYNSELFICGRMKDLVIIRGRNHYPQDIEATAESHAELRPGCCAAFAYSTGGGSDGEDEQLAIVAELRDPEISNKASLCGKIRAAIAREHGVRATLIVLLSPRSIPKTTSGKISRSRCKQALEAKQLSVLYRNEDMIGGVDLDVDGEDAGDVDGVRDETMERGAKSHNGAVAPEGGEKRLPSVITGESPERVYTVLLGELAQLLGVDKGDVDVNLPLQELGLDSMALTQLQGIVSQKFHVHVDEQVLYGETTSFVGLHAALCGLPAGQTRPNGEGVAGDGAPAPGGARGKKPKLLCGCIAC
jgi:acyl-CoA synthetase (AMP-forming)/AMP-acid ligase II/acyl carrier protein